MSPDGRMQTDQPTAARQRADALPWGVCKEQADTDPGPPPTWANLSPGGTPSGIRQGKHHGAQRVRVRGRRNRASGPQGASGAWSRLYAPLDALDASTASELAVSARGHARRWVVVGKLATDTERQGGGIL